ncbi:Glycoside hydrolase family 3 protein [Teratosphaeria destructans]|uniref:xylan 1,4-beta-xylosidase n=1 Tax=Teratosphaeria destructans TaxID=418781 RepID=A0A9W7SYB0_9PEZI|nr:Glycoside hydrolase family 3 protein [Teratosphaeria destructans]
MSAAIATLVALAPTVWAQAQTTMIDFNIEPQPSLDDRTLATIVTGFPSCIDSPLSDTPVCNTALAAWDRASALVSLFSLEELVNNTGNTNPGVSRLGFPPYQVWNEALHGLARAAFTDNGTFSWVTSFPQPILSMASMNKSLINQIGSIISTQGRAYSNNGRYGLDTYAPNINGFRSPVWGRGQETPGEDAFYLTSVYAYEYITGMQGGVGPAHPKLVTVAKHFAGYDIDNWNNHSRLGNDVNITQQDLAGYYTPQFRAAIMFAKSGGLMCSYNAVNGVPSCANSFFLQTLLRDTWGFGKGFVSSDCGAIYNVYNPHLYAANQTGAAADTLRAGTDIDCGTTYPQYLGPAFAEGLVSRDDIEIALTRLYNGLVEQECFDGNGSVYRNLSWDDVVKTDAWNISYEAAVEGITLLKNDGTLPLSDSNIKSVALIGPCANATLQLQGNYYGNAPYLISPLAAFEDSGLQVNFANGTDTVTSTSTSGFAAALAAANQSDVIIFLGGLDNTVEAEGMDRESIAWPGNQLDLIDQLSALGKPVIVGQFGGGQVDDSPLVANDKVSSIFWGGYPGQSGGQALFDIIFGKRTPAGRLVTTHNPADYVDEFYQLDMTLAPTDSSPGQTYMWYTGTPAYAFGHGLFYTTFTESLVASSESSTYNITDVLAQPHAGYEFAEQAPLLNFTFTVENTGDLTSDYSAMLFVSTTSGPTPRPIKWLVGIDRVADIAPGGCSTLVILVSIGALARADNDGNLVVCPGSYTLALNNEASVTYKFTLTGTPATIAKWPLAEQQIPAATTKRV